MHSHTQGHSRAAVGEESLTIADAILAFTGTDKAQRNFWNSKHHAPGQWLASRNVTVTPSTSTGALSCTIVKRSHGTCSILLLDTDDGMTHHAQYLYMI